MKTDIQMCLTRIMKEYLTARQEVFKQHPLGQFVRQEVPSEFEKISAIDLSEYKITASVGQGNWAQVPWIAIMNKDITTSTQRGYYIVYLFSEDMKSVYLTMAQGVTETSREDMLKIKEDIQASIHNNPNVIKGNNFNLGASKKARDYVFSTAAYIRYDFDDMPEESDLVSDLESMIGIYENFIDLNNKTVYTTEPPEREKVVEGTGEYMSNKEVVNHIYQYITGKGFLYSKEEVTNLFLSLKTKPFVILSGISGTGKTMIAQWFAESLGANEDNSQLSLIPVRPDWNDGSDLLGYVDIKGDFQEGPLTKIIRKAEQDPTKPYFVLLDEMNLARVEYYFSDILSVMENRKWRGDRIESSLLLREKEAGFDVRLPENLYMIGTVNMDETTHPFSKKVLDRANTIEFNKVNLGNLTFLQDLEEIESIHINQEKLASTFLHLKDVFVGHEETVRKTSEELIIINESLVQMHLHVGYRVRDEICFYLAYNEEADYFTFEEGFDYCILQKILPRISGSDSRVDLILRELYLHFTNMIYDETMLDYESDLSAAKYPQSAKKVLEMLRRLEIDGFTSFWIT